MPLDPRTPVLVGVAQVSQRFEDPLEGAEPLDMMVDAVRLAAEDARSPSLLERADAVRVSRGRWRYGDPARVVAERIGAPRAQSGITPWGGNTVQSLVNATALQIQAGERDVVVLAGAEHGYRQARAARSKIKLSYTAAPGEADWSLGPEKPMVHEAEIARRIVSPVQFYPIFELALRHHLGESPADHAIRISELWAGFAAVARDNPHAWIRDAPSAEVIRTPGEHNRMIGFPYPKLMNANNAVDQGAALILCSVEAARRAGVPEDRFVHLHAGTDADDPLFASNRRDLYASPAMRIAGRRCLELAGCDVGEVAHFDVYSCFPSAVQIAAREIGLPDDRPLSVTGGLTFGGGPLNNYVMHAIARMAELLRADPGARGLVTGNGGYLAKHAFGLYSSEPAGRPFVHARPQEEVDAEPTREAVVDFEGPATLESYTVMFDADGPTRAHAACLLEDGRRTWANSGEADLMASMLAEEFCGRKVSLEGRGGLVVR
ncbi:MAG: acetyl-CoA acetyltransferase [Myxococcota bacterium]